MKTTEKIVRKATVIVMNPIVVIAFFTLVLFTACSQSADDLVGSNSSSNPNSAQLAQSIALPLEPLNEHELHYLQLMREEEKLAKDVYYTLYKKWNARVFLNIMASEQKHMQAVQQLLQKYELLDPITDTTVGVFSDTTLQDLYDQLTVKGSTSLLDAYTVGATIEDLDIFDLQEALIFTDNQDLTIVWGNLRRGSENHLRAFHGQIMSLGGTYSSQFISSEELEIIVSTSVGKKNRHN